MKTTITVENKDRFQAEDQIREAFGDRFFDENVTIEVGDFSTKFSVRGDNEEFENFEFEF